MVSSELLQVADHVGHVRLALADRDVPVGILLSLAPTDHASENFCGSLIVATFLLHCRQLLLQLYDPPRLGHHVHGTDLILVVLANDVHLLAPTLARRLEQVGSAALHGYIKEQSRVRCKVREAFCLLEI